MARVVVQCSECLTGHEIDESNLGQMGTCTKCGLKFTLRRAATPPPAHLVMNRPRGADGILLDWEPGDIILDLYEVVKLPGTKHGYAEGGMGRVNLVRHREWQRDLAVKSVLPAKSASARDIEKFTTEAEQWVDTIGLHPNIVACHYVRVLGGVPRVFIEYVDSGTLSEWIDSKRLYEGGPQAALGRILDVAIQTAWGLHYVHELGLIHQDVKPLNVMMTADGIAKITDFGLASAKAIAFEGNEQLPVGETILATWGGMTPAYCSPEQAEIAGKNAAGTPREQCPKLTRRTDVWSWAASVLHMFLGEIAWPGGQVAHVGLQREPEGSHLPGLPQGVKELLQTCLERRPENRPHDLMQVANALLTIFQEMMGWPYSREQPKPEDLLADSFNNRGVSLMDIKKQEAAEKKWQEALQVDPHHPEATFNWGLMQWRSVRITDQELLKRLREVHASSADSARVDYLMGLIHLERADAQAAVHLLSKAVEAEPGGAEITSALALAQSMSRQYQLPRTFDGHTSSVTSVSWSPDGRFALSGSMDQTVRLWEVPSGKCLRTFKDTSWVNSVFRFIEFDIQLAFPAKGHTHIVESVSWSPDGRYALSGSYDETLRLWQVSNGKCLRTFKGHRTGVSSVSWSPDGHFALSGSGDNTLRLWEVSNGTCLRTFEGHTSLVLSVSWSPDGRYALSGSYDKTLRLWEVSGGNCLHSFEGHADAVYSVSWSPDGRFALSGSGDKTLRLWEVSSGKCLRIFTGHTDAVSSVSLSPDGRFALSGSKDNTVRLWEMSSGRCLRTFEAHTYRGSSVSWSPNGRFALWASQDYKVWLWEITVAIQPVPLVISVAVEGTSVLYHRLLQQVRDSLANNPAIAAGLLQQARQQHGRSRREDGLELARRLSRFMAHRSFVEGWEKRSFIVDKDEMSSDGMQSVAWSPDGRFALSASRDLNRDFKLRLWEVSSGKCVRIFGEPKDYVESLSWSPDGCLALSGSYNGKLRLWDVSSGKSSRTFEGHTVAVTSVSWSPDGRFALSGSKDKRLRLWEVSSGRCLRSFKGHTHAVTSVSWSPDGRLALSGSSDPYVRIGDKRVRLWDVSSGKCLRSFKGHTHAVTSVSWSPDGCFALSGSLDTTLRLWEVSRGKCLLSFEGHTDAVYSVSLSPNGRFALSGSHDKTLRLWDVSSGECLRIFEGHIKPVTSVSWSPDSRFAFSGNGDILPGSGDETLRVWELDWEFERNQPADWDEGARPFLNAFLTIHTPYANGMVRRGKPTWTEEDFRRLLDKLGCAGFGWLRPEGVCRELDQMAKTWKGPPPIPGKVRGWLDWLVGR